MVNFTGVYSEPCQAPKMKPFAIIVKGFQPLTILAKIFILDVLQDCECASALCTFGTLMKCFYCSI